MYGYGYNSEKSSKKSSKSSDPYGYNSTDKSTEKSIKKATDYGYAPTNTSSGANNYGYATNPTSTHSEAYGYTPTTRKRVKNADSWFDEEDDEAPHKSKKVSKTEESSDSDLEIIDVTPAMKHQKPRFQTKFEPKIEAKLENESSEEDALDAFMSGIEKTAKRQISQAKKKDELQLPDDKTISGKGVRDDIENLDDEEQYFKWIEENPEKNFADPEYASLSKEAREYLQDDEAEELINYDEQGHMHVNVQKKDIDCLPVVYHSQIEYPDFGKNFYKEDTFIKDMSLLKAFELREKLEIKVESSEPVEKPVCSFAHFERSFHPDMFKIIRKQKFTSPTAIQAQALPSALSGRDIIGIAKTGSGKTVAFCWPAIIHAAAQQRKPKDGPIVLIISPTRELCLQTYEEIKKYACVYNLKCIPLYGGGTMWEQAKHCQKIKPEIVIGTPGRIMDHVRKNNISLKNVTLFTLDEADRMFDMGFEYQVRSICDQIRPDRQGLLFSATFPKQIQKLCKDVLQPNYVSITAGDGPGQVNKSICQMVRICDSFQSKLAFVNQNYVGWTSAGGLLIFVTKKEESEKVGKMLKERHERGSRPEIGIMHGDMTQFVRNEVLHKFRLRQINCLVATDVCARGLDISHIRNVVCFTAARNIDTHVHRVGRTGRAGNSGRAYILLDQTSKNDIDFTESMIEYLQKYVSSNMPKELDTILEEYKKAQKEKRERESNGEIDAKLSHDEKVANMFKFNQSLMRRSYNFRTEFMLPGSNASEKSQLPKPASSSSKKYMSKFVKASGTVEALTKEKAFELMRNNPD